MSTETEKEPIENAARNPEDFETSSENDDLPELTELLLERKKPKNPKKTVGFDDKLELVQNMFWPMAEELMGMCDKFKVDDDEENEKVAKTMETLFKGIFTTAATARDDIENRHDNNSSLDLKEIYEFLADLVNNQKCHIEEALMLAQEKFDLTSENRLHILLETTFDESIKIKISKIS